MKALAFTAAAALLALAAAAAAVESDPLPVPLGGARTDAIRLYNEGVALLVARKFRQAQAWFEAALAVDSELAEAHNNLAYALRMQGRHNFAAALAHYDHAISLKPKFAQAYMYRGVLFSQQGDLERARADLAVLRTLDHELAAQLERAITTGAGGSGHGGVAAQYD